MGATFSQVLSHLAHDFNPSVDAARPHLRRSHHHPIDEKESPLPEEPFPPSLVKIQDLDSSFTMAPLVVVDPVTGANVARSAFAFREVQAAFQAAHKELIQAYDPSVTSPLTSPTPVVAGMPQQQRGAPGLMRIITRRSKRPRKEHGAGANNVPAPVD